MRALVRYWYLVPIFSVVVLLQVGLDFVDVHGENADGEAELAEDTLVQVYVSTSAPTQTSTLRPTATATFPLSPINTPTFTPSATHTPTPTNTPTGTLTPTATASPSVTPTGTFTPTPEPTPVAERKTVRVPILMYHYVSDPPPGADAIRLDLSVRPAQFETHLAYLRHAGYQTISMEQLSYALSGRTALPEKPVILTFDDGYRDNYENAFPLLRQYGYTGTFFPITQPIDQNNDNYLTWDMVIEMHRAGMEFGSHSYRHADLTGRDVDFLVYEIVGSKEALEERIGEPVRFFSYPSGRYDALTIQVLRSAHFWAAVTTEWGVDQSYDNRFELVRVRVRGNDTAAFLAGKLASLQQADEQF